MRRFDGLPQRFDGLQKEEQQLLLALYDPHQPEVTTMMIVLLFMMMTMMTMAMMTMSMMTLSDQSNVGNVMITNGDETVQRCQG